MCDTRVLHLEIQMSRKTATHLSRRGNMFQYQRRVPRAVTQNAEAWNEHFHGQPTYRVSLGTSDYAEALERASTVERRFDQLVKIASGVQTLPVTLQHRSTTAKDLSAASRHVRDSIVNDWRQSIKWAALDEEAAEYLHWKIEKTIDEEPVPLPGAGVSISELSAARKFNSDWQINADERSDTFAELVLAVRDGRTQARKDVSDLMAGKSLPDTPSSTLIAAFDHGGAGGANVPKFSRVVAEQRRVSNFSPKTILKADRAQRLFVQLVGDKPIDLIQADDVHKFIDAVATQRVGKSDRPVSRQTVQSYLTQISSPLNYALERRWATSNPAMGHKIKHWVPASDPAQMPPKRPFTTAELREVFAYPWFHGCHSASKSHVCGDVLLDDMRYWAPVLALYTGARAAELGGLKLSEIVMRGAPHIVIQPNEYRRTKSGRARIVPILDALLRLGFDEYLEKVKLAGSDRLFPDWDCPKESGGSLDQEQTRWANSKWIRSFNRTVIPSVLPLAAKSLRSAVTFHSFRGSFKTLLFSVGPEKKANAIIGHTETDLDKRYLSERTPEDLHRTFAKLDYVGLVIPSRGVSKTLD